MNSVALNALGIIGLLWAFAAWAENDGCLKEGWPEGSAMHTGCLAQRELSAADDQLNAVYKKLLASLPTDETDNYPKKTLIEAERAWIRYRDAECAFEAEQTGAVRMWKSAHAVNCEARLTAQRVEELKKLQDGD